jgi:hypothetical protein
MHFLGHVTRGRVAEGSKSDREAILVTLPEGRFILRRKGGNAFHDPELERLVDREVEGEGAVVGQTLIASQLTVRQGS